MTNFDPHKFEAILKRFQAFIEQQFCCGRERKSRNSPKDVLVMTLCVPKHGGPLDFMGKMFSMKTSSFESLIAEFNRRLVDAFYEPYVEFN